MNFEKKGQKWHDTNCCDLRRCLRFLISISLLKLSIMYDTQEHHHLSQKPHWSKVSFCSPFLMSCLEAFSVDHSALWMREKKGL